MIIEKRNLKDKRLSEAMLSECRDVLTVCYKGTRYPVYVLMEAFIKITNKRGKVIPFHLNYQQCIIYKAMCEEYKKGNGIRVNILKARQLGSSTFIAAFFFVMVMFDENKKAAIVADMVDHAKNIFEKIEFMYSHLDDSNEAYQKCLEKFGEKDPRTLAVSRKPKLINSRGQTFLRTERDSVIEVVVAGESSGRSTTYQYIHFSEVAFFPNLQKTITALLSTVDSTNKDSVVMFETTANGFNEYKDRWDKAYSGRAKEIALFIPWFKDSNYQLPCSEMPSMEDWLYEKQRKFNLTKEQMRWYRDKYLEIGSKEQCLQEFPFEPLDAFISSGASVFGTEAVARRKEEVVKKALSVKTGLFSYQKEFSQDGNTIKLNDIEFIESKSREIRIFKSPERMHPYVGVCDPNNGGSDYSAIQIIDNITGEQVACFSSRDLELDQVAYQFYCLGKMYNNALLSSEMNTGQVVMDYLLRLGYENLYVRQSGLDSDFRQKIRNSFGHKTTRANRDAMIRMFTIAFKDNPKIINDYETLVQMENFQKIDHYDKVGNYTNTKIEAKGGYHDDLITSFMAYYIVRNQQEVVPLDYDIYEERRKKTIQELIYEYENRNQINLDVDVTGIKW